MEEKDKNIESLDETIRLEQESIPAPEDTLEACIDKAHRLAAKIAASGIKGLEGVNFDNVTKIAKGIDEALADAKCKVDCITITGDAEESAGNLESFAGKCEAMLSEIRAAKARTAERLYSLSDAVLKAKRLDMGKVKASIHQIVAEGVQRITAATSVPIDAVESGRQIVADIDKKEITKNLGNLVQKSKGDQKLDVLVDWGAAGISKTTQVGKLTVDDLQSLIVHKIGGAHV